MYLPGKKSVDAAKKPPKSKQAAEQKPAALPSPSKGREDKEESQKPEAQANACTAPYMYSSIPVMSMKQALHNIGCFQYDSDGSYSEESSEAPELSREKMEAFKTEKKQILHLLNQNLKAQSPGEEGKEAVPPPVEPSAAPPENPSDTIYPRRERKKWGPLERFIPPVLENATISQVMKMDISKQLHTYEVEYHVLQDEMIEAGPLPDDSDRSKKLEKTNTQLRKQNMDLLEKLQAARQKIQTLETSMETFLSRESKMKHMIRSLEQEKAAHQKTIERMRSCVPPDTLTDVEMTQIKTGPNGKAKTAAKKP